MGIVGGIALAILAALASSICSGGSGSLDDERPTVAVPDGSLFTPDLPLPEDTQEPVATEVAVDEATPTEAVEPPPTLVEPTDAEPTPIETLPPEETVPPTPEATASPQMADY